MKGRGLRATAAAMLSFVAASAAAQVQSKSAANHDMAVKIDASAIAPDPEVRFGTMANGFRYAVMQNKKPAGSVSVRLLLKVGSYDEADDELGYAHFIEHMAFRSNRAAPEGVLDNPFAAMGVALGRDQNAFTTVQSTVFGVDVPQADANGLGKIVAWMRGAADGVLFSPAAIDIERGVVISELQTRRGPLMTAQRDVSLFQLPGFRSSRREPGGTEESLRAATPARLQAFYDRWYRPNNALLVIVGDVPVDELEAVAKQGFSDWTPRGAAGVRAAPPASVPPRSLDAMIETAEALPPAITNCRIGPKPGAVANPLERLRRDTLSTLWTEIINERLKHLSAANASPLLSGAVGINDGIADARPVCIVEVPNTGKWKEALQGVQAELRRFDRDGPTQQELDEAVEQQRAPMRGAIEQADSRTSQDIAVEIVDADRTGRVFTHPDEALRTFDVSVAGIKPGDVRQGFERDWSGSGPLLVAMGPMPPARSELLAAWQANEAAAAPEAYADRQEVKWPYTRFGRPGRVDRREVFADFVRLHFRNGTILNFKHTAFSTGGIDIRVRFGRGEGGLAQADRATAEFAVNLFPEGGLGRLDYEQIGSAFASTGWKFNLDMGPTGFVLSSSPFGDQVEGELQLLAAYMTDPAFRPDIDAKLPTAVDFIYNLNKTNPVAVATDAMEQKLFPGQALPPQEVTRAWRAADFARILKPIVTRSPLEVTIVGDLDEDEAKAAVAATFGALPARPALPADPAQAPLRRFPTELPWEITAFHQGPHEKAAAMVVWPLYTAVPERRKEEEAISLVAAIFRARLFHETRVRLGKVYEADVVNPMPDYGDEGWIAAKVEATPADLDALVAVARKIAADLAAGNIRQEEVDQARQLLVAARVQAQSRNAVWAGVVAETRENPHALDELLLYPAQMKALTIDDVRAAAAAWLKREPLVVRSLPQPTPASTATH